MQESAARRRRIQPEHLARPRPERGELSVAATTPDWLLPDPEPAPPAGPSRAATAWAEGRTPLRAAHERRTVQITGQTVAPRRRPSVTATRTVARPDRIAGWAVVLGLFLVLVAELTAHA
jgi:hypothetical protein